MATFGGNFVSIAHLEIPLLIKMLMCQILIFPAVYRMDEIKSIFKHCSFKTTDFKPLKQTTDLYACAVSFCVRGARFFFFANFEQLHKHNNIHQNPRFMLINTAI